jgi:hypothetical protein
VAATSTAPNGGDTNEHAGDLNAKPSSFGSEWYGSRPG